MDDLIELATYQDEDYGLIVQFLDRDDNCIFCTLEEDEKGEKVYNRVDSDVNRILEEKYFSMESDVEYE